MYQNLNFYFSKLALLSCMLRRKESALFDRNILSIIFAMGEFPVFKHTCIQGTNYTTTILEYLKRFQNQRYLVFPELRQRYENILACLTWSVQEVPFKRDEYLIHLILQYIHDVDLKCTHLITEGNIFCIRQMLDALLLDTESFLNAIYYIYRYPNWQENHAFIVDYVRTRLGHCYYFE